MESLGLTPESADDADTEGHRTTRIVPDDDVEGHRAKY